MSSSALGQVDGSATASTTSRRRPQIATGRRETAQRESLGHRERKERQKVVKKNLFTKDLPNMMYAFGDDVDPLSETVAVVEEILIDYLTELCKQAAMHSTNAKRLKLEDLKFALRQPQQARQLARVEELLYMQEDIARARKIGDYGTMSVG